MKKREVAAREVPHHEGDSDRSGQDILKETYSAQSPDELALVNAAKVFGMRFKSRPNPRSIVIEQDLPHNPASGGPPSARFEL